MMKLEVYTPKNSTMIRSGNPAIRFYDTGTIAFTRSFLFHTGIKAGEKVSFVQDEDNPRDWYVRRDEDGFLIRTYGDNGSFVVQSAALVKLFKGILKTDLPVRVPVAIEPEYLDGEKHWALLTSALKS